MKNWIKRKANFPLLISNQFFKIEDCESQMRPKSFIGRKGDLLGYLYGNLEEESVR